jgi:hypothetical protein
VSPAVDSTLRHTFHVSKYVFLDYFSQLTGNFCDTVQEKTAPCPRASVSVTDITAGKEYMQPSLVFFIGAISVSKASGSVLTELKFRPLNVDHFHQFLAVNLMILRVSLFCGVLTGKSIMSRVDCTNLSSEEHF